MRTEVALPSEPAPLFIKAKRNTDLYQIVNEYRNHEEHRGITVAKLKHWNGKTHTQVQKGERIWLEVPPHKAEGGIF